MKLNSKRAAEVEYISSVIREAAERVFRSRILRHKCHIVSSALALTLEDLGFKPVHIQGAYVRPGELIPQALDVPLHPHAWVEVGDLKIDLTLTQFERDAQPVAMFRNRQTHVSLFPIWGFHRLDQHHPAIEQIRERSDYLFSVDAADSEGIPA